jgi:hypothetical protein
MDVGAQRHGFIDRLSYNAGGKIETLSTGFTRLIPTSEVERLKRRQGDRPGS